MAKLNVNPQNPKDRKYFHDHNYSNENAVSILARYAFNDSKTPSKIRGFYGTPNSSPECIQNSFATIANIHDKDMIGHRKAEHFIFSFQHDEVDEVGEIQNATRIIDLYCQSLASEHQLFYSVHEDKKHLHAHIVINPINYRTGKRMQKNRAFLNEQLKTVDELVDFFKDNQDGNTLT